MVGDFNLPNIQWETGQARGKVDEELLEAIQAAGLDQLIDFPTHTRGNILDLILTNIPDRIHNIEDKGRLGRSDHCVISFEVDMAITKKQPTVIKNWKTADWQSIRAGISNTVWPTATDNTTVEEFWQKIRERVKELTDTYVPESKIRSHKASWMTRELLQLIRRKRRLWKRAKHGQQLDEYETVSKDLKNRIRAAKRSMEKKLAKADARNKKPFYNYIKQKTKSSETVGPLKTPTGEVITDDKEMAGAQQRVQQSLHEGGRQCSSGRVPPGQNKAAQVIHHYTKS
jgi:hypothetical protein